MLKHSLPPLASSIFIAVQEFFKTKFSAMKKLCLTFFAFVMVNNSYGQVGFGIKSGMNIATTKDFTAFPKNRIGWYGGGFILVPIHKRLFLQTELLYSSKGQRTEKIIGASDKSVLRLNYLNVPILLGYKIDYKTSLLLGPEIGYLTSAQLKYYSEFIDVSKNYPSKFDAGLDVGINYKLLKNIGVEIRYSYGFKTMYYEDAAGVRHSESKGANRAFQIGILYPLK